MPTTDQTLLLNVTANATTTAAAQAASAVVSVIGSRSSSSSSGSGSAGSLTYALANATSSSVSMAAIEDLTATTTRALIGVAVTPISGAASSTSSSTAVNDCRLAAAQLEYEGSSLFGIELAVPEWEAILMAIVLSFIILLTIVGNILVILSVFTYKPLRIVQNFFIVSLAVADLTVALLVLPFNVAYSILGRWEFGIHVCKMWLTCDIMCCTSSILNLCAIALDRYWAITDPINYAQKRTVGRVLLLIVGVWIVSLVISSPPLLGWNDWPAEFTSASPCELNSDPGYVIYSSLGSFFIPLAIMTIVYVEIYIATRRRLRERAKATKIHTIALKQSDYEAALNGGAANASARSICWCLGVLGACCCCGCCRSGSRTSAAILHTEGDSLSSETHAPPEGEQQQQQQQMVVVTERKKTKRAVIKDSIKHGKTRGRKQQDGHIVAAKKALLLPDTPVCCDGAKPTPADTGRISAGERQQQTTPVGLPGEEWAEAQAISSAEDGKPVPTPHETSEETSSLKNTTPPQSSTGANNNMQRCATTDATTPLQTLPTGGGKKPGGVYQFIEEKQKISLSKERRAARTLGIIMGVFVICWLPFFLMYVILPFCSVCCPTSRFKNFITWLGYINSGLNPVIYTIFNLDYRRAFKRLLGLN